MTITALIDSNAIGYAEHYATKLRSGNLETQAVFGFIRKMREMRQGYPGVNPICLWDGRADWRFEMCPLYKSNRRDTAEKIKIKEKYIEQRPYIARALESMGVRQMTGDKHEADDLAGLLVPKLLKKSPDSKVILFTSDHDWYGMIRPNVILRDPKDAQFILKPSNFFEVTGYKTPIAFLEGKALQGDNSDVVAGIEDMGEKTAREFLAQWGSVSNFYAAIKEGTYTPAKRKSKNAKSLHPEQILASREGRALFLRNVKLMQLLKVEPPKPHELRIVVGKPDKEKFAELCEELAFSSILKNLDHFFQPFEEKVSQ